MSSTVEADRDGADLDNGSEVAHEILDAGQCCTSDRRLQSWTGKSEGLSALSGVLLPRCLRRTCGLQHCYQGDERCCWSVKSV